MMDGQSELVEACKAVLKQNDLGGWTRPAAHLYPHQWLWDSCFIAIGQRHYDVQRAQKEIKNLFRGQWKNGMLPNTIMGQDDSSARYLWKSSVAKEAPRHTATSGITQPPMVAEAVVRIGEKLKKPERLDWYRKVFPGLLLYHEWLYRERDPHEEGLVILVHPWESGLDNNPAWIQELYVHEMPLWIKTVKALHLDSLFTLVRSDTKFLPAYQRIDTIDALNFYSVARKLRRRKYETRLVLRYGQLTMEDIGFNSILIRANTLLCQIASEIKADVPEWLLERFTRAPKALESLWSEEKGEYFSRNFQTFESIEQSSIMTFLPLYSGAITKKRAGELVALLRSKEWWLPYPVPSVPKNSQYFDELRYWQGPTWINTNWLIADGLQRYGYKHEAQAIIDRTIELATLQGLSEYFSPITGSPAGAHSFSWSAALVLDMLYS